MKQMALQGRAEIRQVQAELAAGKAVDNFVTAAYHRVVSKDRRGFCHGRSPAALPDAVWNVGKVLAAGSKMASEAARIDIVVSRAAGDAACSDAAAGRAIEALEGNRAAARAKRYAEIGEKTRTRAAAARL